MNHGNDSLDKEDMDLIATAMLESADEDARLLAEAQSDEVPDTLPAEAAPAPSAAAEPPPPPAVPALPAPTPSLAAPSQAPAAAPAAQAPAAPTVPHGSGADLRAALRGARHAEQEAREQAARLAKENEELRARVEKTPAADSSVLSAEELETLKDYDPRAYAAHVALQAELETLRKAVPAPKADTPAFRAPVFEAPVQEVIDQIPILVTWQYSATDQERFELTRDIDRVNEKDPAWAGKPAVERISASVAEAARRLGLGSAAAAPPPPAPPATPPKPKTLEEAEAIIAQLTHQQPQVRTGDLNGGVSPSHVEFDPHAMAQAGKTDEEIIAAAVRYG